MSHVVIAVPFLSRHDAVSNDARAQVQAAQKSGFEARLYAELFQPGTEQESISTAELRALCADEQTILVAHMCVAWHLLDDLLAHARCKVILRYHNITPPEFFAAYDREGSYATRVGLAQMARLIQHPKISQLMVNSAYTLEETERLFGKVQVPSVVVAPFMVLSKAQGEGGPPQLHQSSVDLLSDGRVHLLFVGRWAPNKGHHHLLGVLGSYQELFPLEPEICLTIAGSVSSNFSRYHEDIMGLAATLNLSHTLRILGGLGEAELVTHYLHATALLVCSEHEGFCVPIVEAQSLGLPVVAMASTAVTGTVGPGQLCVATPSSKAPSFDSFTKTYDQLATAVHWLIKKPELKSKLVAKGYQHAAQFSLEATSNNFQAALGRLA